MSWKIEENSDMGPQQVYGVLKHHNLLPESVVTAASICNAVGTGGKRLTITDTEENGALVAEVFVSGIEPGESASFDLIPVASYFRKDFDEKLRAVLDQVLLELFDELNVRRIGTSIPESRSRTKRALCSLGFQVEGRLREAVKLHGETPQDLRVLGMLRSDFVRSE